MLEPPAFVFGMTGLFNRFVRRVYLEPAKLPASSNQFPPVLYADNEWNFASAKFRVERSLSNTRFRSSPLTAAIALHKMRR
jgi:hypothetical protein